MKTNFKKVVFIVLGVILIAEIAALLFLFIKAPDLSEQMEPGSSAVHVGLSIPQGTDAWPSNAHIPISINASSNKVIRSVALYINGIQFDLRQTESNSLSTSYADSWSWQPGSTGQYILVARAMDDSGAIGISQPVLLTATNSSFSVTPVETQAGDTLESIGSDNNISLEDMISANPGVDPANPENLGSSINIPNTISPIINQKIIPGFTFIENKLPLPGEDSSIPEQDQTGDLLAPIELIDLGLPDTSTGTGNDTGISPIPQLENFKFWLKNDLLPLISKSSSEDSATPSNINPPVEPKISVDFKGCDVKIKLINSAAYYDPFGQGYVDQHEDGFFLYRSRDGGKFERIATWPKIIDFNEVDSDLYTYGYTDSAQYGLVTYYVSSFNEITEIPSQPASVPLGDAGCEDPNSSRGNPFQPYLEDGILHLPFGMDLAYFYIQIDNGQTFPSRGWRVPEGDRTFLPESGMELNLYTYLNTILDKVNAADLDLIIQVWGWSGQKLVHAGDFKVSIHRSVLLICSVEGEGGCTGSGGGSWLPEIYLTNLKPVSEQKYEVRWLASKLSPLKDICIQLAAGPYPNEDFWQVSMPITSYCMDVNGYDGVFLMNLGATLYPEGPKSAGQWGNGTINNNYMRFESNWFQYDYPPGIPFTLYMRAYPRHESSGFNRYANIAVMHYNTPPLPSEMPPLASTHTSLYDIEILEDSYVPPVFATEEKWGCVIVEEDPTGTYQPGQEVCPPPMNSGHDDCAGENELWCLIKGAANSLGWLYDYVVSGWDQAKWQYAKWIAAVIPYCSESDDCIFVIKKGIDYGIQYATGIPSNPPASEDLIADSIASYIVDSAIEGEKYYTGMDVSAIEAYCEVVTDCKEEIAKKIKEDLKTSRSIASQPACVAPYEAYFHGKQPTCLDPSIIVHPSPGGGNYPGSISIRITRKTNLEGLAVPQAEAGNYRLDVTVFAENNYNNDAISGFLYQTNRMEIPWLDPGESFVLSTSLNKCDQPNLPGCGGGVNYYGFEALYFGAVSHMKAVEACYSTGSSWEWVPCLNGGSDTWDFTNPSNKLGQP